MENTPSVTPASERRKLSLPGLIIVLIGLGMLLDNLGWDWVDKIWLPVALIVIGILILLRGRKPANS